MKQLYKLSFLSLVLLTASCGGGGGSSQSSSFGGKVIDGYIQGAQVCLDLNNNGACDAGEPTTTTAADGSYTLSYSGSTAGKHILAIVGIGANDSDLGPITSAYNLLTPAESPSTVTPLTTLVSQEMIEQGVSASSAAETVKISLKSNQNPLAYDFKRSGDTNAQLVAQTLAASIAQTNITIRNAAGSDLTTQQIMKAAIKK